MTYEQYITQVKNNCISIDNLINHAFIKPDWRHILREQNLLGVQLEDDIVITIDEIIDVITKQVEMYNGFVDFRKPVMDWIFDMLYNKINPILNKTQENASDISGDNQENTITEQ